MAQVSKLTLAPPSDAVAKILALPIGPFTSLESIGMRMDMWMSDRLVGEHTDSQPVGFWTYLWILHNDQGCELLESVGGEQTPLVPGSLLCFNGALPHSTKMPWDEMSDGGRLVFGGGRLVFLAWDMPHAQYTLEMFHEDLVARLKENLVRL